MLDLIATWRRSSVCREGAQQMFLERQCWMLSLSDHITENGTKNVLRRLTNYQRGTNRHERP